MHISRKIFEAVDGEIYKDTIAEHSRTSFSFVHKVRSPTIFPVPDAWYDEISNADRPISVTKETDSLFDKGDAIPRNTSRHRSASGFSDIPLTDATIKRIIHQSFCPVDGLYPYPSAGALYPVEVFILMCNLSANSKFRVGSYHLLPKSSKIEFVNKSSAREICRSLFHSKFELSLIPSFVLVYQINFPIALLKYRTRGYRFALMEAGSMYQAAEWAATNCAVGSRVWGGFSDGELSKICGTNPTVFGPCVAQLFGTEDSSH